MLAAIVEDKDMDKNSNLTVATKLPLTAQRYDRDREAGCNDEVLL